MAPRVKTKSNGSYRDHTAATTPRQRSQKDIERLSNNIYRVFILSLRNEYAPESTKSDDDFQEADLPFTQSQMDEMTKIYLNWALKSQTIGAAATTSRDGSQTSEFLNYLKIESSKEWKPLCAGWNTKDFYAMIKSFRGYLAPPSAPERLSHRIIDTPQVLFNAWMSPADHTNCVKLDTPHLIATLESAIKNAEITGLADTDVYIRLLRMLLDIYIALADEEQTVHVGRKLGEAKARMGGNPKLAEVLANVEMHKRCKNWGSKLGTKDRSGKGKGKA